MIRRYWSTVLLPVLAGVIFGATIGYSQGQPTVQWQNVLTLINSIQSQLNSIQTNSLPTPTTANAIVQVNPTADGYTQTASPAGLLSLSFAETTAATGTATNDVCWGDSTAHRLECNSNNAGAVQLVQSGADINTSDLVTKTHIASATNTDLAAFNSTGNLVNYAGASCTNQALTALSAAGGATCGSYVKSVTKQVFTTSGTYTPTTGMLYALLECVGGGGAGGSAAGSATGDSGAGGAGAGSYCRALVTAAQVGASKTVTIGAGGTPGSTGNNAGGNGGDTSIGSLCVGKGGTGGGGAAAAGQGTAGAGGVAGTSDIASVGNSGQPGDGGTVTTVGAIGGAGGASYFGGGSPGTTNSTSNCVTGVAGGNYGAGGSGGSCNGSTNTTTGGAGTGGACYVQEWNSQ